MTTTSPVPSSLPTAIPTAVARDAAPPREPAIDVARAWCLTSVVVLHAIMVGVSVRGGVPLFENAMEHWAGFPALTWVLQVMPLFFVLGGFSSWMQWSRLRARGTSPATYVAMRVRRLLPPAIGAIGAMAAFLVALTVAGVAPEVVAVAGFRMSMPLWFLGVYLACSALVPAVSAAYRRSRAITVAALVASILAVDTVRGVSGIEGIGFANLLFVWLLLQVVGFAVAEGLFDQLPRVGILAIGAASFGSLGILCGVGVYPWDLLDALNPPLFALVLLGMGQLSLLLVVRGALTRLAARPVAAFVAGWINARAMTIYAWHMLVLIGFAGFLAAVGIPLPVPLSSDWWATRPLWLLAVGVGVVAVAAVAGRLERPRRSAGITIVAPPVVAVVLGIVGVLGILVEGSSPTSWIAGGVLLAVALKLADQSTVLSLPQLSRPNP